MEFPEASGKYTVVSRLVVKPFYACSLLLMFLFRFFETDMTAFFKLQGNIMTTE